MYATEAWGQRYGVHTIWHCSNLLFCAWGGFANGLFSLFWQDIYPPKSVLKCKCRFEIYFMVLAAYCVLLRMSLCVMVRDISKVRIARCIRKMNHLGFMWFCLLRCCKCLGWVQGHSLLTRILQKQECLLVEAYEHLPMVLQPWMCRLCSVTAVKVQYCNGVLLQ